MLSALIKRSRRRTGDAGFAMPSAIIILFIITVLTGTAITVATQTSTSTTRDTNVKAEVEAAEAGLHVASYRLSQLTPTESQCIAEGKVENEESKCKNGTESLGNGATFHYKTTKAMKVGEECAGRKLASIPANTAYRCVTSEGTVNGVEPAVRLQAQVKATGGQALFPVKGVVGLNKVFANGNVKLSEVVASNGEITDGGAGSPHYNEGFELCAPSGKFYPPAGAERKKFGGTIGPEKSKLKENPPYEKTRNASECPLTAAVPSSHATAESNEDSRIGAADKLEGGGYTWNKAKWELTLEGTAKLTLGESGKTTKYFFCSFKMPGGGPQFKIAVGAKVEIFIGDPSETPKKCAAGTGTFEIAGGSKTENEAKDPAALLVVMGGQGPFKFANGSGKTLEASIYAPNAEVHIEGGVKFRGGVVGYEVWLEGGSEAFEWSATTGALTSGNPSNYSRETWEQCLNTGSGC